ncbi:formate dehydrogenase accessory protein FdhD1 [Methanobrevibacter ruminantium M1]|uniref:Formate dehydrogenase accessory protein FdhD1 n=1 Tax=Methanobrevibacter ruminantium (strain ATCC 35063 / DSM 1093 / JCM 13430 / OCM 146 / M1) TaxID=634498 RepID=D3E1X1_METRM|nr:formate dehydrogenase accessory sulfurtransferase FdhD [Methanobrevibacter ruminantium]ADC46532.1 formate dehydrogenase accessory protein FdhD1 [Methanobrevibacter ruminantium M1]
MDYLKKIPAIRWKDGKYEEVEEKTVSDENIYFYIDLLPPRKFSTYPADLEDFGVGYCLGDGLVNSYDDILSIDIDGKHITIKTKFNHGADEDNKEADEEKPDVDADVLGYQSVMSDSAGGWRSELKKIEPIESDLVVNASEIIENMKRLTAKAEIWQATGSVHVAQLVYGDKFITREDVSRHVAVDKVIGAAAKAGFDLSKCYVTYSGRMPADMVIKMVRVGVPILVSNAAPAGSGYEVAVKGNITLVGFVRSNRFNVYASTSRIDLDK